MKKSVRPAAWKICPGCTLATLIGMLIANALFSRHRHHVCRGRKFLPLAYRFAIANLFHLFRSHALRAGELATWLLARSFFVWVSVFNLFATTLFGPS